MNHDDDRVPLRLSPDDARQAQLLNAFLDDLRREPVPLPPGLDPGLSRTARLTHDLGAIPNRPLTQRAAKAQTWERLMQPAEPPPIVDSPAPFPLDRFARQHRPLLLATAGRQPHAAPRPRDPSRLRRLGHRSLGLAATVTLVTLVALSGLAVYLSAPRPDGPSATMLAGLGVSTSGETPGHNVLLPNRTSCTVAPRDYDQTMALLEPYLSGSIEPPVPVLDSDQVPGQVELPVGPAPDAATADAIAAVWGMYQGCQLSREYRRSASLFTDDGLIRYYLIPGGAIDHLPSLLAYEPVADADLPALDEPSTRAMTDLRLFDDGRWAAAFLSTNWTNAATPPLANDIRRQFGHIVFVHQGNRWLIDELTWW